MCNGSNSSDFLNQLNSAISGEIESLGLMSKHFDNMDQKKSSSIDLDIKSVINNIFREEQQKERIILYDLTNDGNVRFLSENDDINYVKRIIAHHFLYDMVDHYADIFTLGVIQRDSAHPYKRSIPESRDIVNKLVFITNEEKNETLKKLDKLEQHYNKTAEFEDKIYDLLNNLYINGLKFIQACKDNDQQKIYDFGKLLVDAYNYPRNAGLSITKSNCRLIHGVMQLGIKRYGRDGIWDIKDNVGEHWVKLMGNEENRLTDEQYAQKCASIIKNGFYSTDHYGHGLLSTPAHPAIYFYNVNKSDSRYGDVDIVGETGGEYTVFYNPVMSEIEAVILLPRGQHRCFLKNYEIYLNSRKSFADILKKELGDFPVSIYFGKVGNAEKMQ